MSTRQFYQCDFCAEAQPVDYFLIKHWFVVNEDKHACQQCGHGLMDLLSRLGVSYKKVCNMYTYDKEDVGLGTIDFSAGEAVALSAVVNLCTYRFRRPG